MIHERKNSLRGFFFTVTALAILSFMLLSMQVWLRAFEQSDIRAAQKFKAEGIQMVLTSLSDKALSDFTSASALNALYTLTEYTSHYDDQGNGIAPADADDQPNNPGTGYVENATKSLMLNGTTDPLIINPLLNYTEDEIGRYTLKGWQGKIRSAANMMGFNASFSDPTDFTVRQTDPWTVRVQFNMSMNITDLENTMRQSKVLHADANISIAGLRDPSITRSDMMRRENVHNASAVKQFFRYPGYVNASDVAPNISMTGEYGSGWFFGPVTTDYPSTVDGIFNTTAGYNQQSRMSQYILVTEFTPELPQVADLFGGIILTNSPVNVPAGSTTYNGCEFNISVQTRCLNCIRSYEYNVPGCPGLPPTSEIIEENRTKRPYIAYTSGNIANVSGINRSDDFPSLQQFVLIDNQNDNQETPTTDSIKGDYHRVWDVTALRDMAICGFYVKGPGPSFFQRMLNSPFGSYRNDKLGLESFVVGNWAGGKKGDPGSSECDSYSRLDREFYSTELCDSPPLSDTTPRIKGMPGCRDKAMCDITNDNTTSIGIGRFRLLTEDVSRYGLDKIACYTAGAEVTQYSPCE